MGGERPVRNADRLRTIIVNSIRPVVLASLLASGEAQVTHSTQEGTRSTEQDVGLACGKSCDKNQIRSRKDLG